MSRQSRYPAEVRERAVGMVFDHQHDYGSQWRAISEIAAKIGCTPETLRKWVRQAERDRGIRGGPTSDQIDEIKELRREVKELRRANEILKSASAFFARELDPRPPK
jgi:transposase